MAIRLSTMNHQPSAIPLMPDSLTFLGTSDGLPTADRYHASLLLKLDGQTLLLDCGEPCSHTLKRMKVDFNQIDAVLLTHTHSDHIAGLPMLIQSMWLEKRTRPLPVWLPGPAIAPLRQWLQTCYLFDEILPFRIVWKPLTPAPFRIGRVSIRAHRTTHLDGYRARFTKHYPNIGYDAFCLLIESAEKRVAYSGDLGQPDDLLPLLENPLDLLITELAHFHPKNLLPLLQQREIRQVAFTHLGRRMRARLPELRALATRALRPRQLHFPRDGDVIRF